MNVNVICIQNKYILGKCENNEKQTNIFFNITDLQMYTS